MTNGNDQDLIDTIRSAIHGETRILTADLSIDELFRECDRFRTTVTNQIQIVLKQFGLKILNSNIEEIRDLEGSEIFKYLRVKANESILNSLRIDVAEGKISGDIVEEERIASTKQQITPFHSQTIQIQNQRDLEVAQSQKQFDASKAEFRCDVEIVHVNASKEKEIREAELQQEVEIRRIVKEKEALKAREWVQATVKAEAVIVEAYGQAEAKRRNADADFYEQQRRAEAQ